MIIDDIFFCVCLNNVDKDKEILYALIGIYCLITFQKDYVIVHIHIILKGMLKDI